MAEISVGGAKIAAIRLLNDAPRATRHLRVSDGLDLAVVNPFEAGA
ncbi:type II toxin-antitoxin system VapC family toxin [Aquibium carbonis]|nr:type II toxin-antitoxin system VapC family toxin [Aquibium carbonis]